MILPDAIDAQVLAGKALAPETRFLQEPNRRNICGNAGGFDAVKLQRSEGEGDDRIYRGRHMTLAPVGCPDPIPEARRLGTAPANIGERQSAQQYVIMLAENEEGVGKIVALVFGIAPDSPSKRRAGEIVGGPRRLPRREKIATCFPQRRPFGPVGHLRSP